MSKAPARTAWVLSVCMALALAGSVYRMPIQREDGLEVIVRTSKISLAAVFVEGLGNSSTMLRPMRELQTKLLGELGATLGNYHLAFRGYHAGLAVLLIFLFTYLANARTWPAVAGLAVGLTVLTGMHTFAGLMREAYPVNHFLLIAVYGLAIVALARSRAGWPGNIAAVLVFALALLTLESGMLLLPIAMASYTAGLRGISKRGLIGLLILTAVYLALRAGLGMAPTQLGERATGFGTVDLSSEEQRARFGQNPLPFYAYNVGMAALTVLVSQPEAGQWTMVQAWKEGHVTPAYWVNVISSVATTTLVIWFLIGRGATGRRRWAEPLSLAFIVVLIVNAFMSFAYSKAEIVSLAGILYALLVCSVVTELLSGRMFSRVTVVVLVTIALSSAWAIRSAGLQFKLRQAAVNARGGWAIVHPQADDALVSQLKQEALLQTGMSATRLPPRYQRWFGEE